MQRSQCESCGEVFWPRPQVPDQRYCDKAACQRERRRRWQQAKRKSDADYRDNQRQAARAWRSRQREYWREYRRTHPQYVEANRTQQQRRNARRGVCVIANMDVSTRDSAIASGTYRLTPAAVGGIANMDAWIVEITVLSKDCSDPG